MRTSSLWIAVIMVSLTALSCNDPSRLREEFVTNAAADCLVIDGRTVLSFTENECQRGYSPELMQFRMGDDRMNNYYVLDVNKLPSGTGSRIKGNLSWASDTQVKSRKGIEFEVVKVSGERIWLWSRKARTGVVVLELH